MTYNLKTYQTKIKAYTFFVGIVLLLVWTVGCKHEDSDNNKASKAPAPAVVVAEVIQKTVPIYGDFVAQTEANSTVEIRARVEGVLEKVHFAEGDMVKKGQLLFEIDPRTYEAALKDAKGELARAKAALEKAQKDVDRYVPLVKEDAVPQQDLDSAEAMQKVSTASITIAEANVAKAELDLSYTKIYSPIDGIIGRLNVNVGNLVGRGENTLLATISSSDPIYVNFAISEVDYLRIAKRYLGSDKPDGQQSEEDRFELILADNTVFPYKGKFGLVERGVDPRTGTLTVRTVFPNPDELLRPGQFGRIRVVLEERPNALLVPQRAVTEVQSAKAVLVVGPGNKVSQRTISASDRYENFWIVSEGLKAGERVIVEGIQKARPGMVVAPTRQSTAKEG